MDIALRKQLLQPFVSVEALDDLSSVAAMAYLLEVAKDSLDAVNRPFLSKQRQQLCEVVHIKSVLSLKQLFLEWTAWEGFTGITGRRRAYGAAHAPFILESQTLLWSESATERQSNRYNRSICRSSHGTNSRNQGKTGCSQDMRRALESWQCKERQNVPPRCQNSKTDCPSDSRQL